MEELSKVYWRIEEASEKLGISKRAIERIIASHRMSIPKYINGQYKFTLDHIEKIRAAHLTHNTKKGRKTLPEMEAQRIAKFKDRKLLLEMQKQVSRVLAETEKLKQMNSQLESFRKYLL